MTRTQRDAGAPLGEMEPARRTPGVLHTLWKRKWLVALGLWLGAIGGAIFYLYQPPTYQSSAQVLVSRRLPEIVPVQGIEARVAGTDEYMATHSQLVKSAVILDRAAEQLKAQQSLEVPRKAIQEGLTVARDRDTYGHLTSILRLTFRGPVAADCPAILTAILDSYQKELNETYNKSADETANLIKNAVQVLEGKLAERRKEYEDFRKEGPLMLRRRDGSLVENERLGTIEAELANLLVHQAEIEARIKAVETSQQKGLDPTPLMDLPVLFAKQNGGGEPRPTGVPSAAEGQLVALLMQEKQLEETFGPDHPELQSVRKRLAALRGFGARRDSGKTGPDAVAAYLRDMRQQLDDVRAAEQTVKQLADSERREAGKVAEFQIREERLRKNIADAELMYDTLHKRVQDADMTRAFTGFDTRVIAAPEPGFKAGPRVLPIFGIALFCGLLVGFGLVWVAEATDRSFRSPDEVRRELAVPILAHIPYERIDKAPLKRLPGGATLDPVLSAYHRSGSIVAEAYRGLRTSLFFSTEGEGYKVVQVTSPDTGDGKSVVAANLAVSMARSGRSVLLIDADCRKPRLHEMFKVASGIGLASVISGRAEIQDAVRPTAIDNLAVLPCGPQPSNPAELLTSRRFAELLAVLRERYDFIILDTPALLVVSDPSVVAPRVDGVVLAVRLASRNSRPRAERACEILNSVGGNLLGVVINGVGEKGTEGYNATQTGYSYSEEQGYHRNTSQSDPNINLEREPTQPPMGPASGS